MTKEEFETIIKPIMLLNGKESQFIRTALLGNFQKWNEQKQLIIPNVIHWLAITEELPEHGETVLTYTPTTEMAEEQVRLIKYGSLKSGFPACITHWKYLDKPTCL